MFIKYNRHLPEFRIVGKDCLSNTVLLVMSYKMLWQLNTTWHHVV